MAETKPLGQGRKPDEQEEQVTQPLDAIKWIGCDEGNFSAGRHGMSITTIVNHVMLGTLGGTDGYFHLPRPDNPSSAHYGIGEDGTIHQYVQDADMAFSNGPIRKPNLAAVPWLADFAAKHLNPNWVTVSVEWAGQHVFKNGKVITWWKPTEAQYQAGLRLHRLLIARHNIAVERAHITRHSDFDRVNKWFCPGEGFPMPRLLHDLGAAGF